MYSDRPMMQSRVPTGGNMFLGASNRKAKTIVLQIQGVGNQVGVVWGLLNGRIVFERRLLVLLCLSI